MLISHQSLILRTVMKISLHDIHLDHFIHFDLKQGTLSFLFITTSTYKAIHISIKADKEDCFDSAVYQDLKAQADKIGRNEYGEKWENVVENEAKSVFSNVKKIIETEQLPLYASYMRDGSHRIGVQVIMPTRQKKGSDHVRIRSSFSFARDFSLFSAFSRAVGFMIMLGRKEWGSDYVYDEKLVKRGGAGRKNKHYKTKRNKTGETNIILTERTCVLKNGGVSVHQQYIVRVVIGGVPHVKQFVFNGKYKNSETNRTQKEAFALAIKYRDELFAKAESQQK